MTNQYRRLAGALLMAAGAAGQVPAVGAQAPAPFEADVVVERTTIDREGAVVQRLPRVRYRLIQRSEAPGFSTDIIFVDTPPHPGRGPLQDPGAGFRVRFAEGEGMRVFDPSGRPLASAPQGVAGAADSPGPSAPPPVAVPRDATARRRDLTSRYGAATGTARRHERYVRSDGAGLEEVLVEPSTALPVEINTVRGGRLVSRSSMTYRSLADGRLYRAVQRDEAVVDADAHDGLRSVTITTITPAGGGR